jgi:hypothetical protein
LAGLIFASKAWVSLRPRPQIFVLAGNVLSKKRSSLSRYMEQQTLKNVNNCLISNIYSYLETSGGQSSNLYLNVVHFFNTCVN